MGTYRVYLVTEASASVEVEADSEEEAIERAFEEAPYACHQCPEIGDWALLSEMYPEKFKMGDDVEKISKEGE